MGRGIESACVCVGVACVRECFAGNCSIAQGGFAAVADAIDVNSCKRSC